MGADQGLSSVLVNPSSLERSPDYMFLKGKNHIIIVKIIITMRSTQLAQSAKSVTLDLGAAGLSPMSGVEIT